MNYRKLAQEVLKEVKDAKHINRFVEENRNFLFRDTSKPMERSKLNPHPIPGIHPDTIDDPVKEIGNQTFAMMLHTMDGVLQSAIEKIKSDPSVYNKEDRIKYIETILRLNHNKIISMCLVDSPAHDRNEG